MGAFPEAQYTIDEIKALLTTFESHVVPLLGAANPSTADQTTVMNFLKQIKDSMPAASANLKKCRASANIKLTKVEESATYNTAMTPLRGFVAECSGTIRVTYDVSRSYSSSQVEIRVNGATVSGTNYAWNADGTFTKTYDIQVHSGDLVTICGLNSGGSWQVRVANLKVSYDTFTTEEVVF